LKWTIQRRNSNDFALYDDAKGGYLLYSPTNTGRLGLNGVTSPTATLHLPAGTTAASTAPFKFTSGSLQTTAEVGAVEFLTDSWYGTITTGAARKTFAMLEKTQTWTAAQTLSDVDLALGTTTGTKIGTSNLQKLSLWNAAPIIQPTTAIAAATLVGGGGTALTDTDTFDGYTLKQIVKALRNIGALA
jgi:hypothetical protein